MSAHRQISQASAAAPDERAARRGARLRGLLALAELDQRIEQLQLREMELLQHLEKLRRSVQESYQDLRDREIQTFLLECSERYRNHPGFHRTRCWLREARVRCEDLATIADAQANETQSAFEEIRLSKRALIMAREGVTRHLAEEALAMYAAARALGRRPALSALVGLDCTQCGADVGPIAAQVRAGSLHPCPQCGRVLHGPSGSDGQPSTVR